jgi:hypothetical protein
VLSVSHSDDDAFTCMHVQVPTKFRHRLAPFVVNGASANAA